MVRSSIICLLVVFITENLFSDASSSEDHFHFNKGKEIYHAICAECHMGDGSGNGDDAPSLVNSEFFRVPPQELVFFLIEGDFDFENPDRFTMPTFAYLKHAEMSGLMNYLYRSFSKNQLRITDDFIEIMRSKGSKPRQSNGLRRVGKK